MIEILFAGAFSARPVSKKKINGGPSISGRIEVYLLKRCMAKTTEEESKSV